MAIFNKMKEPVFLKESSDAERQLERLKELEPLLNAEGQAIIRQDMRYLEYGILGEKNIAYELKNCHMPMYILHDIYLEDGDLNAQIDYLVFTKKICFVIECKNLYGNIEINSTGDFIRTIEFGNQKKREGIYSPITQNRRHLELMKKIKRDSQNNVFMRFMTERGFEDITKSVVVLANPKTVLNARYAKKEIRDKVIRADQLVQYIKNMYENSNEVAVSEDKMLSWAQSYLKLHKDIERDYTAKYNQYIRKDYETEISIEAKEEILDTILVEETEIFKELKAYRLQKSREEKVKPYFIYNDNQLKDLIAKMPGNRAELQQVAGFGEIKANKYGDDILKIVAKYQSDEKKGLRRN